MGGLYRVGIGERVIVEVCKNMFRKLIISGEWFEARR